MTGRGEDDLIKALRSGDEAAFVKLVDRLHQRLVRVAISIVIKRELAEEVVQETWIAVIRGLDQFEERSSLQTWIYRICVNRARTAIGREIRSVPFDPQEPGIESSWFSPDGAWATPVQPWPDAADARIDAAELAPRILEAINELPEDQRLVVTLRDLEGLSSAEVCDALSISEGNQRVLLHRGRNRLRSAFDSYRRGG
jgi:RNA polymerase sigma-70 factor, ECF subfamily